MKRTIVLACVTSLLAAACGSSGPAKDAKPTSLTIVAYDSFVLPKDAFDTFTKDTGISVKIVTSGDAGTMLSKAGLTAGKPEGDVMWGVDNTLLSRALSDKVFTPYTSPELPDLSAAGRALVPNHEATPVDEGDVCINYDKAWLVAHKLAVPTSLDDFTKPEYKHLLVVENPATSSTGLAFMLATVAKYGASGWLDYWKQLRANDVSVVDSWDTAYEEQFSGSSGKGAFPFVVSYGSSPPFEVIGVTPKPATAPTGVIDTTCFHQVEFAGILRGTKYPAAAGSLIDFLVSKQFQELLPLNLYVDPARTDAVEPPEFTEYAVKPKAPWNVSPADIEANSKAWITSWTETVVQ
ncbi:MAG TPA: thiamine ABC transporter substrate-binding protein [Ilumatobacteraceae bacterium]